MITLGTWLTDIDEAVMEALLDSGFELPPTAIAHNLEVGATPDHVGRRLRKLESAGFVYRLDEPRGYYGITETGKAVAREDESFDRERLNELEPDE